MRIMDDDMDNGMEIIVIFLFLFLLFLFVYLLTSSGIGTVDQCSY